MKNKLVIPLLISLAVISCKKEIEEINYPIGDGFEIYSTKTPYSYYDSADYSMIDLDTILISDTPILRYNDLKKYDTTNHILSLRISDACFISFDTIPRQMFVVTINKEPIYFGFKRYVKAPPYVIAPPINWVYIDIPLDQSSNDIIISFIGEEYSDPRLDKRIVDRLIVDGKIE
ncbi:MAG: hypothetical protein WCX31_17470 [Salinivirgaceae bacterium]